MRVKKLLLRNFHGFEKFDLEFGPRLNVLVGENGAGKSTVLSALATLLTEPARSLMFGLQGPPEATVFTSSDFYNGANRLFIQVSATYHGQPVTWSMEANRLLDRVEAPLVLVSSLREPITSLRQSLRDDRRTGVPLAVRYATSRMALNTLPIRGSQVFDQFSALAGALEPVGTNFRSFFDWFREREDFENELKVGNPAAPPDHQLSAVRSAIETMLPSVRSLRVQRQPPRMTVQKGNLELSLDQLSDGEVNLLAMVGDLSRRLAIANPAHHTPNHCAAVVLIDEVELHLHPRWQRLVVPRLLEVFSDCQFILTTHSAQVLGEVPSESVVLLEGFQPVVLSGPTKGRDANAILAEVLGAPIRSAATNDELVRIDGLLDQKQFEPARRAIEALAALLTDRDPEIARLRALLHFLEE